MPCRHDREFSLTETAQDELALELTRFKSAQHAAQAWEYGTIELWVWNWAAGRVELRNA